MASLLRMSLEQHNDIALEGFFDSIKSLFEKKIKVKDSDLKLTYLSKNIIETIKKTFTDKNWVSKNIKKDIKLKLSASDLRKLIVDFKLLEPETAIDTLHKKYEEAYSKYAGQLKEFNKKQKDAEKSIEEFYKKNKDSDKVEKFGMDLISKIPIPKVPDYFKQYNKDIFDKNNKIANDNIEKTYSLSIDEIVKLATKVIDEISFISQHECNIVSGSGLDGYDFWDDYDGYDGEKLRVGELGKFFYFQGLPDQLNSSIYDHKYSLNNAIYIVLKLITKSVNVDHDFKD